MACGRNYCVLLGVYGNAFFVLFTVGNVVGFAPAFARITAVRFAACRAVVSCGNYLIVFNYHGSVLTTKTGGSSCNGCRDRKVIFVFAYTLIHYYKFSFAAFKPLLKTFRTEIVLKNGSESAFDFMRQIHYFSLTSRDRLGKKKFEMQQKWAAKGKCLRHSRKTADFLP